MKRQLRTFAIFSSDVRSGRWIEDVMMRRIYEKLLRYGFVETSWQFVFRGQIGGLIMPHSTGGKADFNEIHIRFYNDRIFAEYEIGRAYISHFFGPRLNANVQLRLMLVNYLDERELRYLAAMNNPEKLSSDEQHMAEWKGQDYFRSLRLPRGSELFLKCCKLLLETRWRPLAALSALLPVMMLRDSPAVGVSIICLFLVSSWVLPSERRP
jgi:hypothetical protein